ncbi:MAG: phosphoribosylaminoimidazolesuccinocarboxamide synthase [Planctomycetota bacterium]
MIQTPVMTTDLPLPNRRAGKVRDVYDATLKDGRPCVVLVATDRLSAFDVVMPDGVPGKGAVLTQISAWWFARIAEHFGDLLPHHLISTDPDDLVGLSDEQRASLHGRVMIGRPTRVVPVECVVRGYLTGSGWSAYRRDGAVCGVELPVGLQNCERLPEPIFTPTTKAAEGHDEPITFEAAAERVGEATMRRLRDASLAVYRFAHDLAKQRGILLADTKFEFGVPTDDAGGEPILIDEALTPDSSRFWPAESYAAGREQPSFDKQFVRDYLLGLVCDGQWDQRPPGPSIPDSIVAQTVERYAEAKRRLLSEPAGSP